MTNCHAQNVVPIRQDAAIQADAREVAERAYRIWLANGFASVRPEVALLAAIDQCNRKAARGSSSVPSNLPIR